MSEAKEKKSKYVLHIIIMIAIAFGFRLLPCPGSVTPYGMAVLGVFVSIIYGWTFIDLLVPSLFGAIALATTGYGPVQTVFVNMFTNTTVLMMMFGILAFAAVEQTGAGDYVISKMLKMKIVQKSPVFVLVIFIVIFLVGNVLGLSWFLTFGLLPLIVGMLKKCGYERGDKFNIFFLAGVISGSMLGMGCLPFLSWGLMTAGTMSALTQSMIPTGEYMLLYLLISVLLLITYPILMKVCGCDFSKLANVDIEAAFAGATQSKDGKMNRAQILSLVSVLVFIVIVVAVSFLANKVAILGWLNSTVGILGMIIVLWLFIIAVKVDGKPLLDMRKAAAGFSWDLLILIAFALLISSALTATETGISAWISGMLVPIFSNVSPLFFLLALAVVATVLTNFSNNIAVCFIMLNIVGAMYNSGFPVNVTAAAVIISISTVFFAILTPAASMFGAILHQCELNTPATIYRWVPIIMVYSIILIMIPIVPYVLIVG